eukprot:6467428-Amphidinium_carterae.1
MVDVRHFVESRARQPQTQEPGSQAMTEEDLEGPPQLEASGPQGSGQLRGLCLSLARLSSNSVRSLCRTSKKVTWQISASASAVGSGRGGKRSRVAASDASDAAGLYPLDAHETLRVAPSESSDGPGDYPLDARGPQGSARLRVAASESSRPWTLNTVEYPTIPSMEEARLLPPTAFEVNAGTTIVVGSQEYVIGRKLGGGAFGVVHEARLVEHQRPTAEVAGGIDMDTPHRELHTDPSCTLAVKLAGC